MITQLVMDFAAMFLSFAVSALPPTEINTVVGDMANELTALATVLNALGAVIPFDALASAPIFIAIAANVWLSVTLLRLGLWVVNR